MNEKRAVKGAPAKPRGPYRKSVVAKASPRLGRANDAPVSVKETTLTPRNRKFAALVAAGTRVADAAKELNLSAPSGYRLLRDAIIKAEIARLRDDAASEGMAFLGSKILSACETLYQVSQGGKEGHKDMPRLKAAEAILALNGITPETMARAPVDPVFLMSDDELDEDILNEADIIRASRGEPAT